MKIKNSKFFTRLQALNIYDIGLVWLKNCAPQYESAWKSCVARMREKPTANLYRVVLHLIQV